MLPEAGIWGRWQRMFGPPKTAPKISAKALPLWEGSSAGSGPHQPGSVHLLLSLSPWFLLGSISPFRLSPSDYINWNSCKKYKIMVGVGGGEGWWRETSQENKTSQTKALWNSARGQLSPRTTCMLGLPKHVTWGGRLDCAWLWLLLLQNLLYRTFPVGKQGSAQTLLTHAVCELRANKFISWVITPWPYFTPFLHSSLKK